MAIQANSPATLILNFRRWDENGADLGPLDLTDLEHQPIQIVLKKPDGTIVTIAEADITFVNAANGNVEWEAPVDTLDAPGKWSVQGWAGEWPSRITAFRVLGPNLE